MAKLREIIGRAAIFEDGNSLIVPSSIKFVQQVMGDGDDKYRVVGYRLVLTDVENSKSEVVSVNCVREEFDEAVKKLLAALQES